jgi:hypothetical protein
MSLTSDKIFLPNGQSVKLCSGLAKDVSDGAHTFNELYEHRTALFLLLVSDNVKSSWWSNKDSKGKQCDPYVLCGLTLSKTKSDITYHLDASYIGILETIGVKELKQAPKWDGHIGSDTHDRILSEAIRAKKA